MHEAGIELAAHFEGTPTHLFNAIQASTSHAILTFSAKVEKTLKAGFKSFCFGVEM